MPGVGSIEGISGNLVGLSSLGGAARTFGDLPLHMLPGQTGLPTLTGGGDVADVGALAEDLPLAFL
jgi:hypothetical protein